MGIKRVEKIRREEIRANTHRAHYYMNKYLLFLCKSNMQKNHVYCLKKVLFYNNENN